MTSPASQHALTAEDKFEIDDEQRELPPDWVRAFDKDSKRHFYVNTPTATPQWINPWDDPAFLATLPPDHPARPDSEAAQKAQDAAARVAAAPPPPPAPANEGSGGGGGGGERRGSWLGNLKEKAMRVVDGETPEAATARATKELEAAFVKRRESLVRGDTSDKSIKKSYAADPFAYQAPSGPFDRKYKDGVHAAYGYGGGWGRQYSPVYGYGRAALGEGMLGTAMGSWLAGAGAPVPGHTKKTNYGFGGA